ncbi:MAG: ribonuclease E inhibitor RraB [Verrucomicrobiales bacterium]
MIIIDAIVVMVYFCVAMIRSAKIRWLAVGASVGAAGVVWWIGRGDGVGAGDEARVVESMDEAGVGGGEWARESGQYPPSEYPAIATARLIRVSLGLLARNGADLSQALPSRHRVLAADAAVVERVMAWGAGAGYEVGEPVSYREHGGVEHFQVDLVRLSAADPEQIEAQGREVFAAVGRIPGAHYQSWMGDIVR